MKNFLVFLFALCSVGVFGQSSDATLTTNANIIKNETAAGLNSATRVGQMFVDIIASKVNNTNLTWANVLSKPTTLTGFGITDGVNTSRTITINGQSLNLSSNPIFTVANELPALGTAFQSLRVNTGATALEYYTPTINPMTTAGDMITGGAAGVPQRLASSTAAFVLTSNGAGVAPSWQTAAAGSSLFSGLTAATGINSINNAAHAQTWSWNTLAGATGLTLNSSSTAAAANNQVVLGVTQTGANATTTQTTYSARFSNTKTGTLSTNIAAEFNASGGSSNNIAVHIPTGELWIGSASVSPLTQIIYNTIGGAGATRAVSGSTNIMQWGVNSLGTYGGSVNNVNGANFHIYDLQSSAYRIGLNASGDLYIGPSSSTFGFRFTQAGNLEVSKTMTAAGTVGAQTINKANGSANVAAGQTTLIVTNNLVATTSNVFVQVYGTDATATSARVTRAAGSFTITLNAAATAETAVGFFVVN